jgi:molybdopterin-containing oxidoreductase family membrane subunit
LAEPQVLAEPTWIEGRPSLREITEDIVRPLEMWPSRAWWTCLTLAGCALLNLGVMIGCLFAKGIGLWGLNNSVDWAFDITNFVFWVGIGHAGTLISAILLLFRQRWRNSINRSAEAMTIFAVMCAAMFPLIHMGRPWDAFFIFPYPTGADPYGSTSAPRWFGMSSPSTPISSFRWFFGIWG